MTAAIPRNRREVREALRGLGARPSRGKGQNFLVDPTVAPRIVASAAPREGDLVLEVGPGLGALTCGIAATGARVLAVEIDAALAAFLRGAFEGEAAVEVLEADALDGRGGLSPAVDRALRRAPPAGRLLLVANLPYSVATPLLQALLLRDPPPADLIVMVQREVADRIRARPSTKAYGPLSVLVQAVARVAPVLTVKPDAFHPVPKVASAVVRITPDPDLRARAGDPARLRRLVHAAFGKRRKTLGNALGDPAALRAAGVDPSRRAEALSPEEFVALARALPPRGPGPPGPAG